MPHEMMVFDPAQRARQISARANELISRSGSAGIPAAFAAVQASVEPTLENVAAFLQTRTNYATIFDNNDVANQTQSVYDELAMRLERLRIHNAQTQDRKPWEFWRPVPSPDLPRAITRIRMLHFNLRSMSTLLRQNTEITQSMLQKARDLKRALELDVAVLDGLGIELPDPELLRQVRVLHQDLLAQVVLIENLRLMLEQRIQIDQFSQERVRNLVGVVLPMVAMMGSSRLDLSPLTADQATEQMHEAPVPPSDRLTAADLIAHAQRTKTHNDHNAILKRYVKKYVGEITSDEARALAKATTYVTTNDWILKHFVSHHIATLKPEEIIKLAKGTVTPSADSEIFRTYTKYHASKLSSKEMLSLANAAYSSSTKRKILAMINL